MLFKKEPELKIKLSEWEKIKNQVQELLVENERLKNRSNFEHLLRDINSLTEETKSLKTQLQKTQKEKQSLERTLENERHTASLVLRKLKEVTDTCENVFEREKVRNSVYVTAMDVYA